MVAECLECREVCRHRMVVEEPGDDVRQPLSLFGDWLVPTVSQFLLDLRQLGLDAVASALPLEQEFEVDPIGWTGIGVT